MGSMNTIIMGESMGDMNTIIMRKHMRHMRTAITMKRSMARTAHAAVMTMITAIIMRTKFLQAGAGKLPPAIQGRRSRAV